MKEASPAWLARQTVVNVASVSLKHVGCSVMVGICTNVSPSKALLVGQVLGDLVINTVVMFFLASWADQ